MVERTLKIAIRRHVLEFAYIQDMKSSTNGTPDLWISGSKSDLWLEVKCSPDTMLYTRPKLSTIQKNWLETRYKENRNVAVVVAIDKGKTMLLYTTPAQWATKRGTPYTLKDFILWVKQKVTVCG